MLARLIANRDALIDRFGDRTDQPVLGALLAAITVDAPNSCVLLGQRNAGQAAAAEAAAGLQLSDEEAAWVRGLYVDS